MIGTNTESKAESKAQSVRRATLIEKDKLRIVITDAPSSVNLDAHVRELVSLHVRHVVRACEKTYETEALESAGIKVHDLYFPDGSPPSDEVRNRWLQLVEDCFFRKGIEDDERISVHCVAGLGRAPVLVAIALIEYCGMDSTEAVQLIRKARRGSINIKQFNYLETYKPIRNKSAKCADTCTIM